MFGTPKKQARLGQWDGRRRSSRSDLPVLPSLGRRPVLVRLAVLLLTVAAGTVLGYCLGPALPYRVGQVHGQDLRARVYFAVVNQPQTEQAREEALQRLPPHQRDDAAVCEAVCRSIPPVLEKYPRGTPLVQRGQPITDQQLALLAEEHRVYQNHLGWRDQVRRGGGICLVMGLLALLSVIYVQRFQAALAARLLKVVTVCGLMVLTLALALALNAPPWHAALLPLAVTTLVLTIVYNPQFALMMSVCLALATLVGLEGSLNQLLVMMGGLATAVLLLRRVRTRTRLIEVGLGAGLAFAAMTLATGMLSGQTLWMIAYDAGRHFLCGALAGFVVSGCLPLVERCFGIVTDLSLVVLADGSHPLLQELLCRAPGTYTHSMAVGSLGEAAAEAIDANPLLARVGGHFHDIGKMLKPQYFVENQTGENRHNSLEPALSTLIILGHVKDGVALATQYNLPRPVIEFIEQHHGTTLVEYFYREALRLQEAQGHGPMDLESSFRYPGPKPRSRECGIVLLADAVESASRALTDPTPSSLRKLVHDLLMKRLLDGQFDECGLTLTELHTIEGSLCKGLIAMHHGRVKYPSDAESSIRGPGSDKKAAG